MKTSIHFYVSLVLAILLYPAFTWKVLFILVGGVLIDIDHYIWYIFKYKKFNIVGCYRLFIEEEERSGFRLFLGVTLLFHTIEFLILMLVLSFLSEIALMFTIGLVPHYILDMIWQYDKLKQIIVNPSLTSWLIKNNK
jgi:hypothetical protein